ncbi:hypothetical protein HanPI659440_Chr03g0122251 [Helianthus annuus]|nr:hypothetical protein HanPI659440_Chr03g0122251 [Helianthus annuus]
MIFLQRIDSEVTQEVNNPQQLLQRQRTTGQQNLLSSLPQSSQTLIGQYTMTYVFGQNSNMKNLQNMSGAVGDLTKESDNWRAQLQADARERSVITDAQLQRLQKPKGSDGYIDVGEPETRNCEIKLRVKPVKRREKVFVGCGAGFGGDRPLAALKLLQKVDDVNYLVLEC